MPIVDQSYRDFVVELTKFLQPRSGKVGFVIMGRLPDGAFLHTTIEVPEREFMFSGSQTHEQLHAMLENLLFDLRRGPQASNLVLPSDGN